MRRLFQGFSNPYQLYRHYIVRRKSPLSWLFWGNILGRESTFEGSYGVSIATVSGHDGGLSFNKGEPGENYIEIDLYDRNDEWFDSVRIHLSYRNMEKVTGGFAKAYGISRRKLKEEQGNGK